MRNQSSVDFIWHSFFIDDLCNKKSFKQNFSPNLENLIHVYLSIYFGLNKGNNSRPNKHQQI